MHNDHAVWDLTRFKPFGVVSSKDDDETEGCSPERLDGGRTVTCQHEGDFQKLLLVFPQCEARLAALEGKVTTIEENIRVQERARELLRMGKSDEQIAAERRRNVFLGIAMLLMPVVTAVLNKLWK